VLLEAITPQKAFELYRTNVEENEQAIPILMVDHGDGTVGITEILDMEVRDGLAGIADQGQTFEAVLLSAEARVRVFKPDGTAETEAPVDCVVISYADKTKDWTVKRQFMRHNGVVTYLEDLDVFEGDAGGLVLDGLHRLVGRA
jgi:hypothetical protein